MEKNKIIIIALVVIVLALLVGIFATMPNMNKQSTNLTFKSNDTINEGDSVEFKLTDANGTAIANQTVKITIMDENKSSTNHSAITNTDGVGSLKLNKTAGKYDLTISYGGNDNYTGCNATKKIIIEKEVVEEPVAQQSQSSSSSGGLHYDPEVNVYYNDAGIIVDPDGQHGQGVGSRYSDVREARDRWERGEPVMV